MGNTETLTISVANKSKAIQNFYLFQEKPRVPGVDEAQIFSNAYGVASTIQPPGIATFTINHTYYALCGTSTNPLAEGVTVSTVIPENVVLGTGKGDATLARLTTKEQRPLWQRPPQTLKALNGFGIQTDGSFPYPSETNIFIGVGADDPVSGIGNKIAVTSIPAEPSKKYTFTPIKKYYVCTGDYQRGEIVDVSSIGNPFELDLTQDPAHLVQLEYDQFGNFTRK